MFSVSLKSVAALAIGLADFNTVDKAAASKATPAIAITTQNKLDHQIVNLSRETLYYFYIRL